ncbi:hypothetical protein IID23_04520 [Patescibacteria group bacterium]|nr:hypothetical protein [Patescibacteria group bacterium]
MSDEFGPSQEELGQGVSLDYNQYQARDGTPNPEEIKKLSQELSQKEVRAKWDVSQDEISEDNVKDGRLMIGESGLSFDTKHLAMGMMATAERIQLKDQDFVMLKYPHLADGKVESVTELYFTQSQYDKLSGVLRTSLEDQGLLDKKESVTENSPSSEKIQPVLDKMTPELGPGKIARLGKEVTLTEEELEQLNDFLGSAISLKEEDPQLTEISKLLDQNKDDKGLQISLYFNDAVREDPNVIKPTVKKGDDGIRIYVQPEVLSKWKDIKGLKLAQSWVKSYQSHPLEPDENEAYGKSAGKLAAMIEKGKS